MSKAVGIPSKENYGDTSNIPVNQLLTYINQLHKARKAGPHHDIRFGDKELFSWATRKGLPEPGGKRMLFQQPIHSKEYADFEGKIPEGYGAGVVSKSDKGTVLVTEATPDKIKFVLAHKKYPEYYTMIRQQGKNKPWLMINHTPTSPEQVLGNKDLFSKFHIKSVPADKAEEFLDGVVEGKVDGASGLFKLKKDSIDVLSYRIGTNGRPIVHTERFFGGKAPKVNIPKQWQNKVLRGEIYGVDKTDQPLSSQEVTPLLNMSLAKSIQTQQDTNTKLRGALFGVAGEDLNTPTRESELKEVLSFLPPHHFGRPPVAHGKEEALKLWDEVKSNKHPEISEGVVVYPESGDAPLKIKLRPEYDVNITGVFPGEGKYTGSAGGVEYQAGDNIGRVGTGFNDDFRRWLWENKDSLSGRTARITSTKQLPSGKYFQPSFMGLHEDYPTKKAEDDVSLSFLPDYTPEQLKDMGVYKEVYGPKDAPRLASLPQWPAHWYNEADPHGWLQWYNRYSGGRRIDDDRRQIKRWLAFKARHGGKAFKENPTPRRAFALRNWGIDATKLVDDPEALKTVMDEYKNKKYKQASDMEWTRQSGGIPEMAKAFDFVGDKVVPQIKTTGRNVGNKIYSVISNLIKPKAPTPTGGVSEAFKPKWNMSILNKGDIGIGQPIENFAGLSSKTSGLLDIYKKSIELETSVLKETPEQLASRLTSGNINKDKFFENASRHSWKGVPVPSFMIKSVLEKAQKNPEPYLRSLKKVNKEKIVDIIQKNPEAFKMVNSLNSFLPKLAKAEKPGLWANIRAKRKRGEPPAKPGDKAYPDKEQWSNLTKKEAGNIAPSVLPNKVPDKGFMPSVMGDQKQIMGNVFGHIKRTDPKAKSMLTSKEFWKFMGSVPSQYGDLVTGDMKGLAKTYNRFGANIKEGRCWNGYEPVPGKKPYTKDSCRPKSKKKDKNKKAELGFLPKTAKSPAWQRSEGKNPKGGLNAKGRASYNKETGGNLKAPVKDTDAKGERGQRRKSFCSRMCGMKSKNTSSETAKDPDSRINKSLRAWSCKCGSEFKKQSSKDSGSVSKEDLQHIGLFLNEQSKAGVPIDEKKKEIKNAIISFIKEVSPGLNPEMANYKASRN
jgi:hypothetical protein